MKIFSFCGLYFEVDDKIPLFCIGVVYRPKCFYSTLCFPIFIFSFTFWITTFKAVKKTLFHIFDCITSLFKNIEKIG